MDPISTDAPVFVLAFANDRLDDAGYLRDLVQERRAIERGLEPAAARGLCRTVIESNATPGALFDLLDRHHDDIAVVHYGGHATGDALMLETEDGGPVAAMAEGLAERLGQLPALRLVFLNGCSTRDHIDHIHAHTRAVVVATERAIEDEAAARFARRFYHALGVGRSLAEAFASAEAEVKLRLSDPGAARSAERAMRLARPARRRADVWPWRMTRHPDAPDGDQWRLKRSGRWPVSRRLAVVAALVVGGSVLGALAMSGEDAHLPVADAAVRDFAGAAPDVAPPDAASARAVPVERPWPALPVTARRAAAATASRPALMRIPAGESIIGATGGASTDAPPRTVRIDRALWVSETPITRGQYRRVMGRLPEAMAGRQPDSVPVVHVTRADAIAFSARLSALEVLTGDSAYRLPTESEWEYICRADRAEDPAVEPPGVDDLMPVGGPANPWGVRDLLGTVSQWTSTPYAHPDRPDAELEDRIVHRGGSFRSGAADLRCSARGKASPGRRSGAIGFRIVRIAP